MAGGGPLPPASASDPGCVKTIAAIHESKVLQPEPSYGASEIVVRLSN